MKFGKKATEFGTAMLVIVTIIIFISAGLMLYKKINDTLPLGDTQYKLLNTYDNAEKILFYIDSSAKQASYDSLKNLAENGGTDGRGDCGKYFGSTLLVSADKNCIPENDDVSVNFESYFQSSLLSYLSQFKTYNINSQYDLWTENQTIKGIALDKVILPIGGTAITDMKPKQEYIATPGNFFGNPSISNKITSCFGYREAGSGASSEYEGIDFSTQNGKEVYSVADGKVIYSDKDAIEKDPEGCDCWGRVLIFHGNGLYTTFLHMDSINVNVNDVVKKGDKIGIAGARYPKKRVNGSVHLHLEVISDKIKSLMIDPDTNSQISYEYNYRGTPGGNFAINPACFFDLSQFDIDYSSKACSQIDALHSPLKKEDAPKKFCDVYKQKGLSLPEQKEIIPDATAATKPDTKPSQTSVTEQKIVSLSSGAVSCQNADLNNMQNTNLKGCYRYYDIFQKYIKQYNLDVDPLLIMSLVSTESSCMNADELRANGKSTADGGIMQVDDACLRQKKCPDVDSQIKEGIKIYLQKFNDVEKYGKELSMQDKTTLVLYSYNRGAISTIINYYKSGQYKLDEAIFKGCTEIYRTDVPKGNDYYRYDVKGKDKCNYPGYGVQYPQRVYNIYNTACGQIGGVTGDDTSGVSKSSYDYSSPSAVYDSIGQYSFTPAFKTDFNFDLDIYNKIFTAIKKLSQNYLSSTNPKDFTDNILTNAKSVEPNIDWQTDCEIPENKVYYSFAESYSLCANSTETSCYCKINFPNDIPSKSEFRIEITDTNDVKMSKDNADIVRLSNNKLGLAGTFLDKKDVLILSFDKKNDITYSLKVSKEGIINSKEFMYNTLQFDKPFYLKKTGSMISFISDSDYNVKSQEALNNPKEVCSIKKDTVKLCVKTKTLIPVYDKNKNSVANIRKDIKFAFTLKDIIPPPIIQDITQPDSLLSEKEAIIKWSQEYPDDDTVKFAVFISKDVLTGKTYKELSDASDYISSGIAKKEFEIGKREDVSSIDLQKPEVKKPFENSKITVQYNYLESETKKSGKLIPKIGALYQIEDENENLYEYFARINFLTSEKYYVAIAAIDRFGNVNMEDFDKGRTNFKIIDVKDTLPPATYPLLGFTFFGVKDIDNKKLKITWAAKPRKNIDGSDFDADRELSNYKIYYTQGDMTPLNYNTNSIQVNNDKFEAEISGLDISKKICFYVVPVDTAGNMQFSDNTKDLMNDNSFFSPVCLG